MTTYAKPSTARPLGKRRGRPCAGQPPLLLHRRRAFKHISRGSFLLTLPSNTSPRYPHYYWMRAKRQGRGKTQRPSLLVPNCRGYATPRCGLHHVHHPHWFKPFIPHATPRGGRGVDAHLRRVVAFRAGLCLLLYRCHGHKVCHRGCISILHLRSARADVTAFQGDKLQVTFALRPFSSPPTFPSRVSLYWHFARCNKACVVTWIGTGPVWDPVPRRENYFARLTPAL